jgi:hypothetical protein
MQTQIWDKHLVSILSLASHNISGHFVLARLARLTKIGQTKLKIESDKQQLRAMEQKLNTYIC